MLATPKPVTFFKAVGRAARAVVKGNKILVSDDVLALRWSQCKACDRFDPDFRQCKVCSCFVGVKVQLATEQCPLGKWRIYPLTKLKVTQCIRRWLKMSIKAELRAR